MRSLFAKTVGGLSGPVYLRHFLFGSIICALLFAMMFSGDHKANYGFVAFALISTALYPYSRFVYENVVGYIVGNNQFYCDAIKFTAAKCFLIGICWGVAIFISPIGLTYLLFRNSKRPTILSFIENPAFGSSFLYLKKFTATELQGSILIGGLPRATDEGAEMLVVITERI